MDEMNIRSKTVRGIISKMLMKAILKKTGLWSAIDIQELSASSNGKEVSFNIKGNITISLEDLRSLLDL